MKKFFMALLIIILIGGAGVGGYYLEKIMNPQTEDIPVATLYTELNSMADILKNLDNYDYSTDTTGDRANPYGKVPSGPDHTGGVISEWRLAYLFEGFKQDAKEGVFYQAESDHYIMGYVLDIEGNVATLYSSYCTVVVEFNSDNTKTVKVYDAINDSFNYFELVFDDAQLLKYEYYYVWIQSGYGNINIGFDRAVLGSTIYYICTLERERWDYSVSQITVQGLVEKYEGVNIIDLSYRPIDETYTVAD